MPRRILLFLFAFVGVACAQSQTLLSTPAVIDVRLYGAKGCPNNDTQAFQAAAKAALYGEMFVPAGLWCIDTVGVAGVRVVGASRWGSILEANSPGAASTYLLDGGLQTDGLTPQPPGTQSGFMAEHLTIDCNASGRSGLRGFYGQMTFQDIWAKGCYDGFTFEMPYMSTFQNLDAQLNTNDGFVFRSFGGECMTSLTIQNLWGRSNGRYGLQMGCFNYVTVSNTAMQKNADDDWHIDGRTASGGLSSNLTLLSPASERSAGRPFYLGNIRGFTITSPLILQPSTPHDWITLDHALAGVILGWVPQQKAIAGTYHLVSIHNPSRESGITTLVQVYASTDPASASEFVFLNSAGTQAVQSVRPLQNQTDLNSGTAGASNKIVCWKDATHLGYCSTNPNSTGTCTCN